MFLCKPLSRGTSQGIVYERSTIPELFELMERHIGQVKEVVMDNAQMLRITVLATQPGAFTSQENTYDVPLGSIVVFNKPNVEVLSVQDFDKKYERVNRQNEDNTPTPDPNPTNPNNPSNPNKPNKP